MQLHETVERLGASEEVLRRSVRLQQFGQRGMAGAEHRRRSRLITGQREIAEIESWSNGATHQSIRPGAVDHATAGST